MNQTTHSHKLESKGAVGKATVYQVNKLTRKAKLIVGGSTALLMVLVFGVGLKLGDPGNKAARAGDESTLGVPTNTSDETGVKVTPLNPMPANQFFSLQLALGTTRASVIWDLNQGNASAAAPFPRNGTYRITSTTDQANAGSWRPVSTGQLGTGIELRFDAAQGDQLAQWTPVGYENGLSTENVLPANARLGQVFYFRLELREADGTWKPIDKSVLELTIPSPDIKLVSLPKYTADTPWIGDPVNPAFDKTNPKISIFWYGNGLDETAADTYLYVSDNPNMSGRQKAVTLNIITNEAFDPEFSTADASYYIVAQEPGKKKYYAVYSQAGQALSSVREIVTEAK